MKTVLGVIGDTFEEELNSDLIAAIADKHKTPRERLRDFSQNLRAFARESRAPDIAPDELRPYIPVNHFPYRDAPSGVRLRHDRGDLDDPRAIESSVDAISQHLLYCHSVAIDNSLAFILDFFDEWWFEERRQQLVHYLHFLHMIKPLIESHVVVLIERPVSSGWDISKTPSLSQDTERALAESLDLAKQLRDSSATDIKDQLRSLLVGTASDLIGHELVACSFHKGNIDLYCPFDYYVPVLEKHVEQADQVHASIRTSGHELMLLRDLVSISLPQIEALSAQEIVDIREDDSFRSFRLDLKRTLERMADIRLDFNREAAQIGVLNEEMYGARKRLDAQIKRSSFLSAARKGMESFCIGALAGLAPLLIDPKAVVANSLVTGSAKAALTVLSEYLWGRPSKAQEALIHHFLVMESGRPRRNVTA